MLEQSIAGGLQSMEVTHAGTACEELQPTGRTYIDEFCEGLCPTGGTLNKIREIFNSLLSLQLLGCREMQCSSAVSLRQGDFKTKLIYHVMILQIESRIARTHPLECTEHMAPNMLTYFFTQSRQPTGMQFYGWTRS